MKRSSYKPAIFMDSGFLIDASLEVIRAGGSVAVWRMGCMMSVLFLRGLLCVKSDLGCRTFTLFCSGLHLFFFFVIFCRWSSSCFTLSDGKRNDNMNIKTVFTILLCLLSDNVQHDLQRWTLITFPKEEENLHYRTWVVQVCVNMLDRETQRIDT